MSAPGTAERDFFAGLNYLNNPMVDAILAAQDENKHRYWAEVLRDRSQLYGKGYLRLYDREADEPCILSVPLVTGGHELNPKRYGGVTPPIVWVMVEPIEERDHPHLHRKEMTMARIHPVYPEDMEDYRRRSYDVLGNFAVPFMVHAGGPWKGASTGCLAIYRKYFSQAGEALNMAWHANGGSLAIDVREAVDVLRKAA